MKNRIILNSEIHYLNYSIYLNLGNLGDDDQVFISLKNKLTEREYEKLNFNMKDFNNPSLSGEYKNAVDLFNSLKHSIIKNLEESKKNEIEDHNFSVFNPYTESLLIDENEEFSEAFFSFNYFPQENSFKEYVRIELPRVNKGKPAPLVIEVVNKIENDNNKTDKTEQSNLDNNKEEDHYGINKNKRNLIKNSLKKLLLFFPLFVGIFFFKNQLGFNNTTNSEEDKELNKFCDSIANKIPENNKISDTIKDQFDEKQIEKDIGNEDENENIQEQAEEKFVKYSAKDILKEFSKKIEAEALNDFNKLIRTFCKNINANIYNFELLVKIKRKNIQNFLKNFQSIRIFKDEIINRPHLLFFISFYYRSALNSIGIYQEKALPEINKILALKDQNSFIIDASKGKVFKANRHAEYHIRNHKNYFFQFGNTNNYDGISIDNNALYISNTNQFIFEEDFKAKRKIGIKDVIEFKVFSFKK